MQENNCSMHGDQFHFDENSETTHNFVTCIRLVVGLLGYGGLTVLEVLFTVLEGHTSVKTILSSLSYRTPYTCSRDS